MLPNISSRLSPTPLLFTLLGVLASLVLVVPAFAPQTYLTYFLLPSTPESPPARVLLRNPAQENATVTLKAFNEQGDRLGQILVTLGPSESKALFPGDDQGELPKETATVQAESDVPLVRFVVFGSLEVPLEVLPASGTMSQTLDFPYLGSNDDSWTTYVLFNPNASSMVVTFRAFDKDGVLLAEVPIVPLFSQETRTVLIEELFDSSLLPFVATVRAIADSPIIGFELTGSFQGEDITALSGISTAGPMGAQLYCLRPPHQQTVAATSAGHTPLPAQHPQERILCGLWTTLLGRPAILLLR